MKILILGSGGRAHTFCWKISQSELCSQLFIAPGNAGTAQYGENLDVSETDFEALKKICVSKKIDLVIVGPEEPLVKGIYDFFKKDKQLSHIIITGPSAGGARLEGSKAFAKAFMQRHNIPTANYKEFDEDSYREGLEYLKNHKLPVVLKADGLAGGKGVVICNHPVEAMGEYELIIQKAKFGAAGKKVVVEGRSMKQNIEICRHLGLLKEKKDTIIPVESIDNYPPDKVVILATGAQGDEFAAMMRMANKTHKYIKITKRDTILLSSSVVPGNERAVQKLKDNLSRQGAYIIHYRIADVHSSGHANKDETIWIHRKIKPKFFMPVHGYHYMLRVHGEIAKEANGLTDDQIIVADNGSVVEIQDEASKIVKLKEKAPSGIVMVDGFSVGDIQDVVIRDRQMLAQDGIFIVFGIINAQTGKLKKSPDIISRGFVYLRESQELLHQARMIIKNTIEHSTKGMNPVDIEYIKSNVSEDVSKFLLQKTAKRPIVIPVLLTI